MNFLLKWLVLIFGIGITSTAYAALADAISSEVGEIIWLLFRSILGIVVSSIAYVTIGQIFWKKTWVVSGMIVFYLVFLYFFWDIYWAWPLLVLGLLIISAKPFLNRIWKEEVWYRKLILGTSASYWALGYSYYWLFLIFSEGSNKMRFFIPWMALAPLSVAVWVWIAEIWLKRIWMEDVERKKIIGVFLIHAVSFGLMLYLHFRFLEREDIDIFSIFYVIPFFGIASIIWSFVLKKSGKRYFIFLFLWIFLTVSPELITTYLMII